MTKQYEIAIDIGSVENEWDIRAERDILEKIFGHVLSNSSTVLTKNPFVTIQGTDHQPDIMEFRVICEDEALLTELIRTTAQSLNCQLLTEDKTPAGLDFTIVTKD